MNINIVFFRCCGHVYRKKVLRNIFRGWYKVDKSIERIILKIQPPVRYYYRSLRIEPEGYEESSSEDEYCIRLSIDKTIGNSISDDLNHETDKVTDGSASEDSNYDVSDIQKELYGKYWIHIDIEENWDTDALLPEKGF